MDMDLSACCQFESFNDFSSFNIALSNECISCSAVHVLLSIFVFDSLMMSNIGLCFALAELFKSNVASC